MPWRRLFPLYLGAAMGPLGGIGILPLLPILAAIWSVSLREASLAITFYMTPFVLVQLFSGPIAHLYDARRTLIFGFCVYGLGALLCALSPGLWALLGSRAIQGLGAAFLTPIIMAMIGELVDENHVGRAIGLLGLAYTVGVTLGPLISGVIEVRFGWRGFFVMLMATAVAAGGLYSLSSRPLPMRRTCSHSEGIHGVLSVIGRAAVEPGVLPLSMAAFSLFVAYIGIMTFTADYLKGSMGLTSDRVGALLSSVGVTGIFFSPVAGLLGDLLGRVRVFVAGAVLAMLAIGGMRIVEYSYSTYLAFFLMFGLGSATAWTSLNTLAVESSARLRRPVTSLYNAVKFSGYALAPLILSVLYTPFMLKGVQLGCMGFIAGACLLALGAKGRKGKLHEDREMVTGRDRV
jgi:MFS family permease